MTDIDLPSLQLIQLGKWTMLGRDDVTSCLVLRSKHPLHYSILISRSSNPVTFRILRYELLLSSHCYCSKYGRSFTLITKDLPNLQSVSLPNSFSEVMEKTVLSKIQQ